MIQLSQTLKSGLTSTLNLIRLELFFGSLFCFSLGYYIENFSDLRLDPIATIIFTSSFAVLFLSSFLIKRIKNNIRYFSNYAFLIGLLQVVYVCYTNRFNVQAFYLLVLCYGLYSFILSTLKAYFRNTGSILLSIFIALVILEFDIDFSLPYLVSSILLLTVAGFLITWTRSFNRQKLKRSEANYSGLINNSIFGILIFNQNKLLFANKKAINLLEYSSLEEMKGLKRTMLTNDKYVDVLKNRLEKLKQGIEVPMKEYELFTAKGNRVYIESKPTLIEYDGKACILSSFVDITERKKAEKQKIELEKVVTENDTLSFQLKENQKIQKELENAKAYAEGIIESSLDMIFTTDTSGKIVKFNSAAKENLMYNDSDVVLDSFNIILEDKKLFDNIQDEIKNKGGFSGEINLVRKDGSTFPAFISISHLYSIAGTYLGIMAVARNLSDIIEKDQEINEQAAKLNTIIESSSHLFFSVDRKLKFTAFNQLFVNDVKEKYGINISIGDSFFKVLERQKNYLENKLTWSQKFKSSFTGNTERFELERVGINKVLFYREIFLNPIYNENGKIEEISGIGHDITAKKLSELQLKKSIDEKQVLLKEVHHRVKNNLQVISSILSLQASIIQDPITISTFKESQNRIRSMALIHERLYKTENFSEIKFSDYLKNLAEGIFESYELNNISVELDFEIEEVFLSLDDAIPCGLIMNELLANALKYAFEGKESGQIKIVLKEQNHIIQLEISDNGIGLPASYDEKSTETLGLQLVDTLIQQIEGQLVIDRSKGTTFKITFQRSHQP